jgi:flagellar basal-body rod protein FlgB
MSTGSAAFALGASSLGASSGSDFFALAERRLDYIDQRQRVLAQNIANADTPDYRARDLSPFEKLLHAAPVTPALTNTLHLSGTVSTAAFVTQIAPERSADGNAVNVEDQLTKVADDETTAALTGNLWKTYMGMYLTALGRGG